MCGQEGRCLFTLDAGGDETKWNIVMISILNWGSPHVVTLNREKNLRDTAEVPPMRVNLSLQGLSHSQLDPPAGTQTSAPFVLEREASPTADQFAQDSLQV